MMRGPHVINPSEEVDETELLGYHFTKPTRMDGAGKLKQHDNVHKQITAFEKLLQHAMSRFSKEKLYQMLRLVQKGISGSTKAPPTMAGEEGSTPNHNTPIETLGQLKMLLDDVRGEKRHTLHKEEDVHIINYFENYFDDLRYLRDLKKHFDEKIYCCLYDYFYDPTDDIQGAFEIDFFGNKALIILEEEKDSGNSSLPGSEDEHTPRGRHVTFRSPEGKSVEPGVKLDHMTDKEKLSYAVREMFSVNQKWDALFIEDVLDTESFEVDSGYELLEFPRCEKFANVFRLVPDVFVKAFKSAELAKLWWTQANKIYPQAPLDGKRNSAKEFSKKVDSLQKSIKDLKYDITHEEGKLKKELAESKGLKSRESRYNILSANCEKIEELKNRTSKKYNDLFRERDGLKSEMDKLLPGTSKYRRMEMKIRSLDQQLIATNDKLKLISYHFDILEEDFNLQLVVRPDIIRFLCDAEVRIRDMEESLTIKRQIKRQAEKQLALLKTNCERMRTIMRKYIGSANQNHDKQMSEKEPRKRYRKRPTSGGRGDRPGFKDGKTDKKRGHPQYLKPKRDATFVTSQTSDQESLVERDDSPRYFNSLEVQRISLPKKHSHNNRETGEKDNHIPAYWNNNQESVGGPRIADRRSRSLGRSSKRGSYDITDRGGTTQNKDVDNSLEMPEVQSKRMQEDPVMRTAQRARRRQDHHSHPSHLRAGYGQIPSP